MRNLFTETAVSIKNGVVNSVSSILSKFKANKTPEEMDKMLKQDEIMYEYSEYTSTKGILGLPPRFSALADMRLFGYGEAGTSVPDPEDIIGKRYVSSIGKLSKRVTIFSEPYEGTKWLDVYMKWGSLVYLEIGRPIFFSGMSTELVDALMSGAPTTDEQLKQAATLEAMKKDVANMISFRAAGVDYAYQVKILTDTLATFLNLDGIYSDFRNDSHIASTPGVIWNDSKGSSDFFMLPESLGDVTEIAGTNRTIKSTEMNNGSKVAAPLSIGRFDLSPLTNGIHAEVISSTICVYSDGGVEVPLNFTHQTGPSTLLSAITDNPISTSTSELAFLASDFNYQTDQTNDDGLMSRIESKWLKKIMGIIPIGAKLVAPEVWQSVEVTKTISFKVILQAANPHRVAVFNEVLVPYMHLFAAFAPMNIVSVSNRMANRIGAYAPPFVVRMYSKGSVNVNLGVITSITVNKVPKDLTIDGLPTRMELDIEIKDLYDIMGIPQNPRTRSDVLNCAGLTEYLSALTGVAMSNEKLLVKYAEVAGDVKKYLYNAPIRAENRIQQNITNAYNEFISGATSVVHGRINRI